jgi:hypothetical protein
MSNYAKIVTAAGALALAQTRAANAHEIATADHVERAMEPELHPSDASFYGNRKSRRRALAKKRHNERRRTAR